MTLFLPNRPGNRRQRRCECLRARAAGLRRGREPGKGRTRNSCCVDSVLGSAPGQSTRCTGPCGALLRQGEGRYRRRRGLGRRAAQCNKGASLASERPTWRSPSQGRIGVTTTREGDALEPRRPSSSFRRDGRMATVQRRYLEKDPARPALILAVPRRRLQAAAAVANCLGDCPRDNFSARRICNLGRTCTATNCLRDSPSYIRRTGRCVRYGTRQALGPLTQDRPIVVVGAAGEHSFGGVRIDGLISYGFLKRYAWTIDFDAQEYPLA